jgi:hypothetical protein
MDDQTFDGQTALEWIRAVEGKSEIREQDSLLQAMNLI